MKIKILRTPMSYNELTKHCEDNGWSIPKIDDSKFRKDLYQHPNIEELLGKQFWLDSKDNSEIFTETEFEDRAYVGRIVKENNVYSRIDSDVPKTYTDIVCIVLI
jgi:hypothetical protein